MAVIRCRACKQPISSEAKACPSCGHPNRREVTGVTALTVIGGLLFFMCYLGFRTPENPTAESNAAEMLGGASVSSITASDVAAADVEPPDLSDAEKVVLRGIIADDIHSRFTGLSSVLLPPDQLPIVTAPDLQQAYLNNAVEADKKYGKNFFIVVGNFLSVERNFDDGYIVNLPYIKAEVAAKNADFLAALHVSDPVRMVCEIRGVVHTQVRITNCRDAATAEHESVETYTNWIAGTLRFGSHAESPREISLAIVIFIRTLEMMDPQDPCKRTWAPECRDKVTAAMHDVPMADREGIAAEAKRRRILLNNQVVSWLKGDKSSWGAPQP